MSVVLVIRPQEKWQESVEMLNELGHKAVCASVVQVEYRVPAELSSVIEDVRSGKVRSLVFASVTAVRSLERSSPEFFGEVPIGTEIVAIGPPTARALGMKAISIPQEYTSEGLLELLRAGEGQVVMLRSDQGNQVLREGLEGIRPYRELVMYSLQEDKGTSFDDALDELISGRVDAVLHTSSFSARLAIGRSRQRYGERWHECWRSINAAIGQPTRDTLVSLGLQVQVMPQNATFPELVRAVDRYLTGRECK